jgi:hypothetical protein
MAFIADYIRDNGLQAMVTYCNLLTLCSAEPTTYAQAVNEDTASGYRLGSKVPVITLTDHTPDGRRAQIATFTDGAVEDSGGSGSGMFWACIDTVNLRLLSTFPVTNDQAVVDGNTFSLTAVVACAAFRDAT